MIDIFARYIVPAALSLLPDKMDTPEVRVMLLAIAGQESGFAHRRQVRGPARGFLQFELGGLRGVTAHPASAAHLKSVCAALLYDAEDDLSLHAALEHNDVLACAIARLLLWTDPQPLPFFGDAEGAWDYYVRLWRPGKPHPDRWPANYAAALTIEA